SSGRPRRAGRSDAARPSATPRTRSWTRCDSAAVARPWSGSGVGFPGRPDLPLASASHKGSPRETTDMTNPTTTRPAAIVSLRDFLRTVVAAAALGPAALFAADRSDMPPDALIGYTELRTDLPGGQHANLK